jgi:ATP-dependent Clp protease adaptor protein ClpS
MTDTITTTRQKVALRTPQMWEVVLHNDDFTPYEFVVALLRVLFRKSNEDSFAITNKVHNEGKAIVGRYTKEIALSKVEKAMTLAQDSGHPLVVTAQEV